MDTTSVKTALESPPPLASTRTSGLAVLGIARSPEGETLGPIWPLPTKARSLDLIPEWVRGSIRNVMAAKAPWPLILWGSVRCGKTCAALCMCDQAGASAYCDFARYCDWHRQAQQGTLAYSTGHPRTAIEVWRDWETANLGVLDELGLREKCSDFQYEILKRSIDARENRPTVYVSNLSLDELAKVYDDRIAARLGEGTVLTLRA